MSRRPSGASIASCRQLIPWMALLAFGAWGCDRQPLAPTTVRKENRAVPALAEEVERVTRRGPGHKEGSLGPGALYVFDVPANWNGDLVVYVHGYTPTTAPVAVPDIGPLRDLLLAEGFAIAASSFSENGYAVAEATRQTHQLGGVFAACFGRPRRTFLLGQSLGGIIALRLAERFGHQYDGALLVCGVVGGSRAEVQYIGDVRVLFDAFYPGCLAGGFYDVPDAPFPLPQVLSCVQAQPNHVAPLACLARLPGANGQEVVTSLLTALGFHWIGAEDLFDRTHHHELYDNDDRRYCCPLVPQTVCDAVNAGVDRHSSTPDAEAFLANWYEPTGKLRIPVLSYHTTRDPLVPVWHEDLYAAKVAAAESSRWLCQATEDRYGHCTFTPQELLHKFLDLVAWADTGNRPPYCPNPS